MRAAIIAAIVATLVSAASATAAFVVTSANIKNGTIETVDISAKAKRVLKGNRGARGETGPAGATGAQGVQGTQGVRGDKGDPGDKGDSGDPGAIAYGVIKADGSVSQATPNVTSTWNAALSRYEITISGVNYHFLSYATVVTPADPALTLSPSTNSIGGQTLLVYFRNASGFPVQTHFGFVTYDP